MSFIAVAIGGGALIGGISSLAAGSQQAGAAKNAQQLQAQEAQNALDFQKQEFNTQQQNEAPWLKAGSQAVGNLSQLANGGLPAWTGQFQAPTAAQAAATPGEQFELQQGSQALDNSAAARGGLLTSGTAKQQQEFGQGLASTNYQQAYNNALQQYQQSYNEFQQNQSNQFNRQASIAGLGQTAAGQLGSEGQAAAGNVANIDLTGGAQQGQQINNAAAATASGFVGAGNAASGALGNLGQYALLSSLLGGGGGSSNGLSGIPTETN
jgi:hypothetical protein